MNKKRQEREDHVDACILLNIEKLSCIFSSRTRARLTKVIGKEYSTYHQKLCMRRMCGVSELIKRGKVRKVGIDKAVYS